MWFERLTGFAETTPDEVREQLALSGEILTSHANGESWRCGRLEVVTLTELRKLAQECDNSSETIVSEQIANVQDLHRDSKNAGALFQVASQFNLLEMMSPEISPERGVDIYENDFTQGPACAISAGAGTIFRNYFALTNGRVGQSEQNQIDCLGRIGNALGNSNERLWKMQNGYPLATEDGLDEIGRKLELSTGEELNTLRGELQIGIQWDTEVTLQGCSHLVTQAYCSALPVAYSIYPSAKWRNFAVLILEAAYEATICTGILNAKRTNNNRLYLTLLGGGAFGNKTEWIIGAIQRAIDIFPNTGLDIRIVSFMSPNPEIKSLTKT